LDVNKATYEILYNVVMVNKKMLLSSGCVSRH